MNIPERKVQILDVQAFRCPEVATRYIGLLHGFGDSPHLLPDEYMNPGCVTAIVDVREMKCTLRGDEVKANVFW